MENQTNTVEKENTVVSFPGKYKVIFFNDPISTMGFVVEILCNIYGYNKDNAIKMMLNIHNNGSGVVGTYIKSIAESKVVLTREVAMKANYPLSITIEEE